MAKSGPKRKFALDRDELNRLYQTMTLLEIATQLGCKESVIHKRIKEFGLTRENGRKKLFKLRSEAHCKALGIARRGKWGGENAPRWRGGLAAANLRIRASGAYKQWKIESRKRVGDRCQQCGILNGTMCECCGYKIKLHCHHIKSFSKFPESRFDPKNSEVLCPKCHNHRHNGKIG